MKQISPFRFKTIFNLYPPLFINRTKVNNVSDNFQKVDVALRFLLMNRNFNGSTFGSSIFMVAAAYFSLMYRCALSHRDIDSLAWLKQAEIFFLKPARSNLLYKYRLTNEEIATAEVEVKQSGCFQKWNTVRLSIKREISVHGCDC